MANATTPVIQINEGNVGIGTTTPLAKLDVQGTQGQLFSVTDNLSGDIFSVADISGVPIMNVNSDGTSYFDGNVGIGTSSPLTKLHIAGTTDNNIIRIENTSTALSLGSTIGAIQFFNNDPTDNSPNVAASIYATAGASGGSGSLRFKTTEPGTEGDPATDTMIITNGGNVGIGVTNPSTKLQVAGIAQIVESGNTAFYGGNYVRMFGDQNYGFRNTGGTYVANISMNGNSYFNGGNVGIGSITPASKLNVASTGANPYSATLDSASNMKGIRNVLTSNTDDMVGIYFATGTVTTGTHWSGITGSRSDNASHWGTQLNFYTHNNDVANLNHATQKMVIKGDGDVGIGVTNPLVKLHVNQGNTSGTVIKASGIQAQIEIQTSTAGDAHLYMRPNSTGNNAAIFKMTAGTNYNWRWQDDATTPVVFMQLSQSNSSLSVKGDVIAYGSPSDERYKENIKPIESALDKVTKLQGVTFDWKESDNLLDIKEDIGFIAQDVQKVVPELVRENEDGKLSLRYQGITPILLEAIKELKAEIDLLKSKPCNCNKCNCNI